MARPGRRYEAPIFESADHLIAKFAEHLSIRKASPRTSIAYQRDLENFGSFLKAQASGENVDEHLPPPYPQLGESSRADILAYQRRLTLSREYSARAIARKLSALRTFFKFLRFDGIREDNPAFEIPSPKIEKSLPKALTEGQMQSVLAVSFAGLSDLQRTRDRAIMELLYSSGLRRSEALNLTWADLDLDRLVVRVLGAKGNKDRNVPMTREAAQALRAYQGLRPRSPEPFVFLGRGGRRLSESGFYKIVRSYMRMGGIEYDAHPHTLRHTAATHLYEHGADILMLKEFLGHESTATVEIYTKVSSERIRRQFEASHPRRDLEGIPESPKRRPRTRKAP